MESFLWQLNAMIFGHRFPRLTFGFVGFFAFTLALATPRLDSTAWAEPTPGQKPIEESNDMTLEVDDTQPPTIVIPAGQEKAIGAVLGTNETLTGECKLSKVLVEYAILKATYGCPNAEVTYEFTHLSKATEQSTKTERFAINVVEGTPPDGLTAAIESHVRAHEAEFNWKIIPVMRRIPVQEAPAEMSGSRRYGWVAGLGLAVAAFILWRRRSRSA